jgi:predicted RNA-binding Zn-ribbon protein involved in translation (DUF1610 family)
LSSKPSPFNNQAWQPIPLAGAQNFMSMQTINHLVCTHCGYNLHGLPADSNCPECGASIQRMAEGDPLKYADLTWIKRVHRGMRNIYQSLVAAVIAAAADLVLAVASFVLTEATLYDFTPWETFFVGLNLVFIPLVLAWFIVGIWQFTACDDERAFVEPFWCPRRILRYGSLVIVGVTPLLLRWPMLYALLGTLLLIVSWAFLLRGESLSMRIGYHAAADDFRSSRKPLLLPFGFLSFAVLIDLVTRSPGSAACFLVPALLLTLPPLLLAIKALTGLTEGWERAAPDYVNPRLIANISRSTPPTGDATE